MCASSPPGPRFGLLRTPYRWMRGLLAVLGLLVVLITATPIDFWWAHAYAGSVDQPRGDVLILLSAASDDQGFISQSSYWRARYALLAWRTGAFKIIVVSGGGGTAIEDFLIAEGVPREAILAEGRSTSTRENGIHTARLLRGVPGTKVLLTSDFHMFRAVRVFRKLGMQVTPYPAPDVMKSSQHWYGRIPGFETLATETTKIVYYDLRGWI